MFIETPNFREFFQDRFFRVDRKYVDISMPKEILSEMAIPLDIAKQPIKPDKDDIEFLSQFPPKYWTQALHQRYYHDLADALDERTARRAPVEKKMFATLRHALETGEYDKLKGVVSDELFYRLQNQEYGHVVGDEKLAEKAAVKLAELETEKKVPHANGPAGDDGIPPGFKKYTFKKSRNGNETVTIVAKPFINRLVHKLERTRGHEHHPESGLQDLGMTHGQYGYDLYGLKRGDDNIPHATRGMQLPIAQEVGTRMSDYLAHNAHRMYGDLDEAGDDIVWKPVGEGRSMFKDNWTWKKVYNKVFPQMVARLTSAEPGSIQMPDGTSVPPPKGFATAAQRRAAAHKLAMEQIFKMAEAGELKGPPIPGIAPQGLPVKVKMGAGGKKMIDAPPLYLPHRKGQKIRVHGPDGVKTQTVDIPLVKPAEYLRQLGSEEGDESIDQSLLRGHQKDYVHVQHNDYRKAKGYVAGGALHVTQNSGGRMHMDPSDPDYQERKEQIENEMGWTGLDKDNKPTQGGEGQYFYDIIKGIWNCINSACGGMTNHEVDIMKQNVHDIHQMVWQRMMMNLRDERLDSPKGRRTFATNVASSWAQQDLGKGGGTRRLRRLNQDARDESMDATTDGKSGGQLSLRDSIQKRMAGGPESSGVASDQTDAGKLKQGEKFRPAGKGQFSYNIDNLREALASLEGEASKVDDERDQAIKLSRDDISDQIAELIGDDIADKAAFMFQLQYYLKQLFITDGLPENEAEHKASLKVAEYAPPKAKAKQIIAAFKADQEVQQMLQEPAPEAGQQKLSMAQQDAVDRMNQMLDQLEDAGKLGDKNTQQMIYNYINTDVPEDARAVVKAEADRRFGVAPAAPAKPATPAASPTTAQPAPANNGQAEVNALIAQKNWLKVAEHPYFNQVANPKQLTSLIAKLEAQHQTMQDGFEKDDHDFVIARLRSLLKKRGGGVADIA